MTNLQIIFLIIGILFALIGIFFIYKRIGNSATTIDIPKVGRVETQSSGIILVLTSLALFYFISISAGKETITPAPKTEIADSVKMLSAVKELGEKYCRAFSNKNIVRLMDLSSTPFQFDDELLPTVDFLNRAFVNSFKDSTQVNLTIMYIDKVGNLYHNDIQEIVTKTYNVDKDDYAVVAAMLARGYTDTVVIFNKKKNEAYKMTGISFDQGRWVTR